MNGSLTTETRNADWQTTAIYLKKFSLLDSAKAEKLLDELTEITYAWLEKYSINPHDLAQVKQTCDIIFNLLDAKIKRSNLTNQEASSLLLQPNATREIYANALRDIETLWNKFLIRENKIHRTYKDGEFTVTMKQLEDNEDIALSLGMEPDEESANDKNLLIKTAVVIRAFDLLQMVAQEHEELIAFLNNYRQMLLSEKDIYLFLADMENFQLFNNYLDQAQKMEQISLRYLPWENLVKELKLKPHGFYQKDLRISNIDKILETKAYLFRTLNFSTMVNTLIISNNFWQKPPSCTIKWRSFKTALNKKGFPSADEYFAMAEKTKQTYLSRLKEKPSEKEMPIFHDLWDLAVENFLEQINNRNTHIMSKKLVAIVWAQLLHITTPNGLYRHYNELQFDNMEL